jgi:quercetin dioxygenase-like cupin family protein
VVPPLHIQIAMSQTPILRRQLLAAALDNKNVTSVDVREIIFEPEQQTGLHQHPCPVFGYIAEGEAILQVKGETPQHLPAGSAFYEPAQTVILRFDNPSRDKKMKFIAFYLLEGPQALIEMLPERALKV